MGTVTNVIATNNQLATNYDSSKLLLGFNFFTKEVYTAGGADVTLVQGLVMGKIASTGKIVPLDKDAVDGSQYPVGIIVETQIILANATKTLTLVNKGKIASAKVVFADVETLDTLIVLTLDAESTPASSVHSKSIKDLLQNMGFVLETTEELSVNDNQ
jgi:hypothetical protein